MASEMTLKLAPKYTKTTMKVKLTVNKVYYEEIMETFLDTVFENESKLTQEEWIEFVA